MEPDNRSPLTPPPPRTRVLFSLRPQPSLLGFQAFLKGISSPSGYILAVGLGRTQDLRGLGIPGCGGRKEEEGKSGVGWRLVRSKGRTWVEVRTGACKERG